MTQQPPTGFGQATQGYPPQQQLSAKWYHRGFIIAATLVFFFPLGLFLLWTAPKASMGAKIGGTVVVGFFVLIAMGANKGGNSTSSRSESPTMESKTTLSQTAAPITDTCVSLSNKFGTRSKLSDLQKEEAWSAYKGKSFEWSLDITEVSSGFLSGYSVQAKCAPESPSLIQDIQIEYGADAKGFVMQLQKGSVYKIRGTLTHTSTLFGLAAEGAT